MFLPFEVLYAYVLLMTALAILSPELHRAQVDFAVDDQIAVRVCMRAYNARSTPLLYGGSRKERSCGQGR